MKRCQLKKMVAPNTSLANEIFLKHRAKKIVRFHSCFYEAIALKDRMLKKIVCKNLRILKIVYFQILTLEPMFQSITI